MKTIVQRKNDNINYSCTGYGKSGEGCDHRTGKK